MPSREYLEFIEEATYGTPVGSTQFGANYFYARLHDSDAFTGQMNPVLIDIPYGGGRATPAQQVSDQYSVMFNFRTYLYAGNYSATLMKWALQVIDSGRTLPWATTDTSNVMPPGDLASLSFYHAFQRNDGTYDLRRYGGAKCLTGSITVSRAGGPAVFSCTGQAIRDDLNAAGAQAYPLPAEFAAPAENQYPSNPYMFSHTGGGLLLIDAGQTARAQYSSVTLSWNNVMDPRWFESKYIQLIKFCGRTTTLSAQFHLKPTPDDLAFLQNRTQLTAQLVLNNGTNSITVNLETNNFLKTVARNLALNQVYQRTITAQNFWDPANSTDLTVTTF